MRAADDEVEVRAIISGWVQGVGFRATARAVATSLHLKGSARNLSDGNVEIIIQGSKKQLQLFFDRLQAETYGRVDAIDRQIGSPSKTFDSFIILN